MPTVSVTLRVSTCGCAAAALHRAHLQPQFGQAGLAAAERNGAAHLGPLLARGALDERIVAQPRLQGGHLLVDGAVDQRLGFVGHIDLDAGQRQGAVAERDLRGEVRLQPPIGGQRRFGDHGDLAVQLGMLIEHRVGEFAHVLAERAAQQAGDGAGEIAGLGRDLAGQLQVAAQRRDDAQFVWPAADQHGAAGDGDADIGLRQQAMTGCRSCGGRAARRRRGAER